MPRAGQPAWTLLLAAFFLLLTNGAGGQPAHPAAAQPLSLLDVPYLSQSEALCGGAAAAMVLRYWGAIGLTAEDFAPLVDRSRGGIDTAVLTGAVQQRGYDARAASGTPELVTREIGAGRPVIALIADRPGTFHYVVVVGWHDRTVVVHDPARTPYLLMRPDDFMRRWDASGRWMLAVVPEAGPSAAAEAAGNAGAEPSVPIDPSTLPCDARVREGVRLAQRKEISAAERLLADAAYACGDAASIRELAGVRVLQRRWPEVLDLAARAVEADAADLHAWRMLATARYVTGDPAAALDAWNRAGEPRLDRVSASGLERTSHRAVERYMDLRSGATLTREGLELAGRRLDELPAGSMTRVEYVPRGSGLAEVRAHVVERTVLPRGRVTWAAIGLRAAAQRELVLPVASLGGGGERLDASWRFWPERPAGAVSLRVPLRASMLALELTRERQPFVGPSPVPPESDRLAASGGVSAWATPWLRLEARGGFARWEAAGSYGTAGAAARMVRGRAHASAEVDAWLGDGSFTGGSVRAGWRSAHERRGYVLDVSGGTQTIARHAPLDLWPAGDTGHARTTLLRAHPVLDDGRLRLERLGRFLAHGSVEAQRWWRAANLVPVGAAVFADLARLSGRRLDAPAVTDVDAGAGLRLALPGRAGLLRVDVAHGLRDGRNALSVAWQP